MIVALAAPHWVAGLLTGSSRAQDQAAKLVPWLIPAAGAQIYAGIAASALAALDDYGTAAFGYAAGAIASLVAIYSANQGSLVEVVNRFGSFFYGSLLGVFILAILIKRATARGAFWGLIAGMVVVLTVAFSPWTRDVAFLWHNLIGAVVVVIVGLLLSVNDPAAARTMRDSS